MKREALPMMLSGDFVEDRTARRQTGRTSLTDTADRRGGEVEGDSDVEETPRGGKSSNRSKERESKETKDENRFETEIREHSGIKLYIVFAGYVPMNHVGAEVCCLGPCLCLCFRTYCCKAFALAVHFGV